MKKIALGLLSIYKIAISPTLESLFGKGCRFTPTCSEYSALAIEKHGLYKGSILAAKRFLRCQPFFVGFKDTVEENIGG